MDPLAAAMALGGASREETNAFLKDQRALIAAQLHQPHMERTIACPAFVHAAGASINRGYEFDSFARPNINGR